MKGWLFVLASSALMYALVSRLVRRSDAATAAARAAAAAAQSAGALQSAALQALAEGEAEYRALAEQVPVIIYRAAADESSSTTYISPQVATLGYDQQEWLDDPDLWSSRVHPDDLPTVLAELERAQRTGTNFACEYRLQTRAGNWLVIRDEARVIRDSHGQPQYLQGIMLDVTGQRAAEAARDRLVHYDATTGLPNRALLVDRLGQLVSLAIREGGHSVLMLLDIDHLHSINDALGYQAGDLVLVELATRLREAVRDDDTVARLQGDVLAVLLHAIGRGSASPAHHAAAVAEKLRTRAALPMMIGRHEVRINVSIGVASLPDSPLDDAAAVLTRASTALDTARSRGGARTAFFDADMGAAAERRFQVVRELRQAVVGDQLRVFLQPQVTAAGMVVGAEALVRWAHPDRGLLLPGAFIPYAEESDLIIDVDCWVVAEVTRILASPQVRDRDLQVAVNISARHFHSGRFVDQIQTILAASGADPSRLKLEVTESLFIEDLDSAITQMATLADTGIQFALDDFGTRYASLAYLKRLPIHELKIDRTFIQDAPHDPSDASLVELILTVADKLHLDAVAEGVETEEQAEFLAGYSKVIRQGYLYGRPQPAADFIAKYLDQPHRESGVPGFSGAGLGS